jgi:hypothetical protein
MPATSRTETARDAGAPVVPWRARAFGLEIELSFGAPGLPRATGPREGPSTRLELATADEIEQDWPTSGTERVLEERFDDGPPARTIDVHPHHGYRLYARNFGLARISPTGARVVCAPPDDEPWSWQRFLVGRILPWAAVLRGHEAFHASAVGFRNRAVAFVGETGAGKTSLAVQLVTRGMEFFTDDVLALERSDGLVRAHPGASIVSVRESERDVIPAQTWTGLGTVLGHSGKTYVDVPRAERPLPLGAIYFLGAGEGPPVERVPRLDPRMLLSSTFVLGVQTPARLLNQLEVCSAIARGIPVFQLRIGPELSANLLAEVVLDHLSGQLSG